MRSRFVYHTSFLAGDIECTLHTLTNAITGNSHAPHDSTIPKVIRAERHTFNLAERRLRRRARTSPHAEKADSLSSNCVRVLCERVLHRLSQRPSRRRTICAQLRTMNAKTCVRVSVVIWANIVPFKNFTLTSLFRVPYKYSRSPHHTLHCRTFSPSLSFARSLVIPLLFRRPRARIYTNHPYLSAK